jgi:hypothetical protein
MYILISSSVPNFVEDPLDVFSWVAYSIQFVSRRAVECLNWIPCSSTGSLSYGEEYAAGIHEYLLMMLTKVNSSIIWGLYIRPKWSQHLGT